MQLINPLPYGETPDSPLNAAVWPNCKHGSELFSIVDADFLVYRCGFAIEHHQWVLATETGMIMAGPFKNITGLRNWVKANGGEEHWSYCTAECFTEIEDFERSWIRMQQIKKNIYNVIGSTKSVWYLTKGSTLQRNQDATIQGYKANRKNNKKPAAYDYLRDRLQYSMKATIPRGIEADDAVAHMARKYKGTGVIVSPDKDLYTVPGLHLNPTNTAQGVQFVSELVACRNLYAQMLCGDGVDNIRGLHGTVQKPGWSVNAAHKEMSKYFTERAMQVCVMQAYIDRFPKGGINMYNQHMTWQEILLENANLLFLRGNPNMKFTMES